MEPVVRHRPKDRDTEQEQRARDADSPRTRHGKIRLRTIDDLDNRTAAARRARDLVGDLESDLGGGEMLSIGMRELVKRAAMLGAIIEDHEVRWLQREGADLSLYGTLVDRQRRILETLGLERRARDVTPDATAAVIDGIARGM